MNKLSEKKAPDPNIVAKYQEMLAKDPNSKVFAPLADAYRQMNMVNEALEICKEGVRKHPDFSGGRIALANIYLDTDLPESALNELLKAHRVAPENIAAISKLAELNLQLKKPKEALRFYKKLLFLSPQNIKASAAVSKLESLTADEYEDDELFRMQRLGDIEKGVSPSSPQIQIENEPEDTDYKVERIVTLADAFFARNDLEKANQILIQGENELGSHPQIVKRLKILHLRQLDKIQPPKTQADLQPPTPRAQSQKDRQIEKLQDLLKKFKALQKQGEDGLDL